MPQVHVNPDEIRSFVRVLKKINGDMKNSSSTLNSSFHHLAESWKDQEFQRFAQEFEQTLKTLQRFMQTAEQHIPVLERKAREIDKFLGH